MKNSNFFPVLGSRGMSMSTPISHLSQAGKGKGSSNFKRVEDICLAKAYVSISTDAAVATDQDGDTFWIKVEKKFQEEIKDDSQVFRGSTSLKNRWNNVVQKCILKFVGFLSKALSDYHSGWTWDDYVSEAKHLYLFDQNREFKFELAWIAIKHVPKFAVSTEAMSAQVIEALGLDGEHTGQLTKQPDAGKKKATMQKFEEEKAEKKKLEKKGKEKESPAEVWANSLKRLADSADERNRILNEQLKFQFFQNHSNEEARKTFEALKAEEYILDAEAILVEKRKNRALMENNKLGEVQPSEQVPEQQSDQPREQPSE